MDTQTKRPCDKHGEFTESCATCRAENFGPAWMGARQYPARLGEFRVQVLRLRGELNLEDQMKIRDLLEEFLRAGVVNVVLDLEQVTHLHMTGLPVLVRKARQLRDYKGDLKLAGASEYITHLLQLAGMGNEFGSHPDADAAVQAFRDNAK
jgi:anti-anti-sigma factor